MSCAHLSPAGELLPTQPCSRCGSFVCGTCQGTGAPLMCGDCLLRIQDPLLREPFTVDRGWKGGVRLYRAAFPRLLAVSALFAIPLALVNHFGRQTEGKSTLILFGYTWTVGLLPFVAAISLMAGVATGRPQTVQGALVAAFGNLQRVARTELRVLGRLFVYALLFMLPAFIPWTACWVTMPAACLEAADPVERSKELTLGRRWDVFALGLLGLVASLLPLMVLNFLCFKNFGGRDMNPAIELGLAFLGITAQCFRVALALATFYGLRNGRPQGELLIIHPVA